MPNVSEFNLKFKFIFLKIKLKIQENKIFENFKTFILKKKKIILEVEPKSLHLKEFFKINNV